MNLISAAPTLQNFEDRSQEETEWQEQGAGEAAVKLAKNVLKLKEHQRATFFSPSEKKSLPASVLKPEEQEFVVDSGATMHMISKKDLSDSEMNTLTKSCSPTIVITANGEVQTHEEARVYVKELYIFLTMKVLEHTPSVLSLGSFSMKTDIPTNGSMVENHISLKTGSGFRATRRTSFLLWFQACQIRPLDLQLQRHLQDKRVITQHLLRARLLHLQYHGRNNNYMHFYRLGTDQRLQLQPVWWRGIIFQLQLHSSGGSRQEHTSLYHNITE